MHEPFYFGRRKGAAASVSFVSAALWLAVTVLAQSANPAPQTPALSDTPKPMTLHVQVAEKDGHLVPGLIESDFTLFDNKQPQKLLAFRAVDADTLKSVPVQVVLVVDMINVDPVTISREREEVGRFLKRNSGELANPTSIAVIADSGVKAGQGSTQDGNSLLAAFSQTQSEIRVLGRDTGFYGAVERTQRSIQQLGQLIQYEGEKPGRKLMLFISPGWTLLTRAGELSDLHQRNAVFNNLVELTNQLRVANITLYCLDPFDLGRTNPFEYQTYLKGVAQAKDATYPNLALQVLATHTGGQVLVSGRDISGEISDAVRDASPSYELTFAPAPGDRANEYHALEVHVDKPSVKIRTTASYYARVQPTK